MTTSLTHPAFWILTALADQRRHGYEIMRETAEASGGRVALKGTTLYAALERLSREGLISADGEEIVGGRTRRYYRITNEGAEWLSGQVQVLEELTRKTRARLTRNGFALIAIRSAPA